MKRKNLWVNWVFVSLSIILILGLIVSGCASKPLPAKESIKVGYSLALSGWAAPGADAENRGRLLWADHVNEKGGIYADIYNMQFRQQEEG